MSGVRSGGPPQSPPGGVGRLGKKPLRGPTASGDVAATPEGEVAAPPANSNPTARDTFEQNKSNAPRVAAPLENTLQVLASKAGGVAAGKAPLSDQDLAYLTTTFAAIMQQHPQASRRKRARLFTRAILKRKRIRRLFAGVPEAEVEAMCDAIGAQLEDVPVFAQLVDEVTEGARKFNTG